MKKLQLYQCDKQVMAAEITEIGYSSYFGGPVLSLLVNSIDEEDKRAFVGIEWMAKNKPEVGGYYMQDEDGHTSYCAAEDFAKSYSRDIEDQMSDNNAILVNEDPRSIYALDAAGEPEIIPLGRSSTPVSLRVTRSDGTLLLELDEAGHILFKRHEFLRERRRDDNRARFVAGNQYALCSCQIET